MKATQEQYYQAVSIYENEGCGAVFAFAEKIGVDSYSYCRDCEEATPDCHDDSCLVCGIYKPSGLVQKPMKKFRIPCHWEVYGYAEVEATSLREAFEIVEDESMPLPKDSSYIQGSFMIDYDGIDYDALEQPFEQPTEA